MITIPSIFTPHEVSQIRDYLNQGDWQDGTETAGGQAKIVKNNRQLLDSSSLAQQLADVVLDALSKNPTFISAALPLKIFPPMFNRYGVGETYGIHVDNAVRFVPSSATRIRSDLSATISLTAPDEYEGGELSIEDQYGHRDMKIEAGDMVLYPSRSLHQVKPVTKGERVSIVIWLQSMVRDNEQRQMLFDLDNSIQSLTSVHGHEHQDVMRLTNLYQNLIRQWADT